MYKWAGRQEWSTAKDEKKSFERAVRPARKPEAVETTERKPKRVERVSNYARGKRGKRCRKAETIMTVRQALDKHAMRLLQCCRGTKRELVKMHLLW
jgi:hypothetical protein